MTRQRHTWVYIICINTNTTEKEHQHEQLREISDSVTLSVQLRLAQSWSNYPPWKNANLSILLMLKWSETLPGWLLATRDVMIFHVVGWMAKLNGHMRKMRKIFVENLFVSLLTTYKVQDPDNLHSYIIIT